MRLKISSSEGAGISRVLSHTRCGEARTSGDGRGRCGLEGYASYIHRAQRAAWLVDAHQEALERLVVRGMDGSERGVVEGS